MARFLKQSLAQTCLKETDKGKLQQFKVLGEDRSAINGKWLNPVVQKWRYLSCYYV